MFYISYYDNNTENSESKKFDMHGLNNYMTLNLWS